MHVKASVLLMFALFSILLFHSTVFLHFTEQINDDDDDKLLTSTLYRRNTEFEVNSSRVVYRCCTAAADCLCSGDAM